jgi:hypothetical protein
MPAPATCESRITRVVVYARGAVVTRRVLLPPELGTAAADVVVPGLTPLAEVGSMRVSGGREVLGLRGELVVPPAPSQPGELRARLRELEQEAAAMEAERQHLVWRAGELGKLQVKPAVGARGSSPKRAPDPAGRVKDALAAARLAEELRAEVERRLGDLAEAEDRNARARQAAALAAAQGRTADRAGPGHPTLSVHLALAPGAGSEALELSYVVGAARWWPCYAARLDSAAARAALSLDAHVAQLSGEDWSDVALSLSTADLARDARLPELPSLRLGRAQAPRARGYRPPPPGLDLLFAGYDAAMPAVPMAAPAATALGVARPLPPPPLGHGAQLFGGVARGGAVPAAAAAASREQAMLLPSAAPASRAAAAHDDLLEADAETELSEEVEMVPSFAGPPPAQASRALRRRSAPAGKAELAEPPAEAPDGGAAPVPGPIEPADAWLDFDALRLAGGGDRARRGRLVREADAGAIAGVLVPGGVATAAEAARAVAALPPPPQATDPLEGRGHFDHQFDADGRADVPSSGRPHRVEIRRAQAPSRNFLRAVPREAAEVYREVELQNPFGAPLLAGPVDVFVDGALLATSAVAAVDTGGLLRLGLGVEDRIRVARNARTEESAAGLLGGALAVDHEIAVDLRSALGHAVTVEVVERAPVTDDPDVDVTAAADPPAARYDQAERGRPIRGGWRWEVPLPAGGTGKVTLRYRVKLPGKSEIVGGNRRE